MPHLCTLVAYYPEKIPSPKTKYPPHLELTVHLASTQGFAPAFNNYVYQDVQPGFAEHDLDEYDKVSASLAWTRTLAALRKGFKIEVDLEKIWEEHVARKSMLRYLHMPVSYLFLVEFMTKDAAATMATMVKEPCKYSRQYYKAFHKLTCIRRKSHPDIDGRHWKRKSETFLSRLFYSEQSSEHDDEAR